MHLWLDSRGALLISEVLRHLGLPQTVGVLPLKIWYISFKALLIAFWRVLCCANSGPAHETLGEAADGKVSILIEQELLRAL